MSDIKFIAKAKSVRVKTAKGRKISSTRWLQRQLNDPYVQSAKAFGYRSRAAYKLLEIEEKFKILKNLHLVVDLGATPGGWCQVVRERSHSAKIIAIDLNVMEEIKGVEFFQMDFLSEEAEQMLEEKITDRKIDLLLSDMAAQSCGHQMTDHLRIIELADAVFEFGYKNLRVGGSIVVKILHGAIAGDFLQQIKRRFKQIKHFKPPASRKDSSEIYLIATGFRGEIN